MTHEDQRYTYTGILGTIAFHLVLLIFLLSVKLGRVRNYQQEKILIEFAEENYKPVEQIIEENIPQQGEIENLSENELSNIVSNVAEKVNEEISTEKYIQEVMDELGMDEMNPKYDNTLPDDPVLADNNDKEEKETSQYAGQTRITVNVPNRKVRYRDRPIYLCQGGGTVVVNIQVDQDGNVIEAQLASSSTDEICIHETAVASAMKFTFNRDYNAPKKLSGTITYIFVAQ